jgi:REP element-mobilizing transposase RayT
MKRWRQVGLPLSGQPNRRKKKSGRPRGRTTVERIRRPELRPQLPVHVTLKLRPDAPRLRRARAWAVLRAAFRRGCDRFGFRLVHFSVQSNHLHLLCEADDRRALARGIQGLAVRIARRMNRLAGRKGKFFADRYHLRLLRSPTQVRRALLYVLQNGAHHDRNLHGVLDVYSSAAYFDGWRERLALPLVLDGDPPRTAAKSWLLSAGWIRGGGRIGRDEVPGP